MKRVEFHVHTIASKDSMLNKYLILFMCKIKKIDCVAITDHNEVFFAKSNIEFFKKHNIDVIVGEEIFTNEGEIIGLFLNKKINSNLSPEDTVREIKKQNGLVYIPHPYDLKRSKTVLSLQALERIYKDVDFIEKYNGRNVSDDFSIEQENIANKYKLRKIVGSDAHVFFEIGRNYCVVDSYERNKIIECIENAVFVEKKCIKFAHTCTKFIRLFKMIRKGDFSEIVRIIKRKVNRGE